MDTAQRMESERLDARLDEIMKSQGVDILEASRIYKNQEKERRYQRQIADRKIAQARAEMVTAFQEKGVAKNHQEAEAMADAAFPLGPTVGPLHALAALFPNPQGKFSPEVARSVVHFLNSERNWRIACANNWIGMGMQFLANRSNPGKFVWEIENQNDRAIRSANPDIAAMAEGGPASEGAVRKLLWWRFGEVRQPNVWGV